MNRASFAVAAVTWLLLFPAGCGHHPEGHGHHESGHESHSSELQLTLDDGEKWQMDEHTRVSAARLEELVSDSGPIYTVAEARALGESLDEELDSLVKGCKMTGPAHDQLHAFLAAFIPRVEALETEADVEDLRAAKAEIDSLLAAYDRHFE